MALCGTNASCKVFAWPGLFRWKLIAAGGKEQDSVECFTLPTGELPGGQWVTLRPMIHVNTLVGILQFDGGLLFVG